MVRRIAQITTAAAVVLFLTLAGGTAKASAQHAAHKSTHAAAPAASAADIVRDPADVPAPAGNRPPQIVRVTLTARELQGKLDPDSGTTYGYWTFDGTVPGPMIRVRQDDTVEVTIRNEGSSHMPHSIDLHAAIGPGGGAVMTQTLPGQAMTFTFTATTPGLFVYHCGTPVVAEHISNGMYGLILVEPPGGLPAVDREFYVMQGELYTAAPVGTEGAQRFDLQKLLDERPEYLLFNGAVGALTKEHPLKAHTGQTVRIYFGNAGPNLTASPHVMGEIFTTVYDLGAVTAPALTNVQTASVPPGGAAILELKTPMPGQFGLVDHAISRMVKGLMAHVEVEGDATAELMHAGPAVAAQAETRDASLNSSSGDSHSGASHH